MKTSFAVVTALLLASFVSSLIAEANATGDIGAPLDMTIPSMDTQPTWDPRLDGRRK